MYVIRSSRINNIDLTPLLALILARLTLLCEPRLIDFDTARDRIDGTRGHHFAHITKDDFLQVMNTNRIPSEFIEVLSKRGGAPAIIYNCNRPGAGRGPTPTPEPLSIFWKSPKHPFTDCSIFFHYDFGSCSTRMLVCADTRSWTSSKIACRRFSLSNRVTKHTSIQ